MKKLSFMLLVAMSILFFNSCKKQETAVESKVKTFVENMSFVIDYAEDDGTGRIYGYRDNYSEAFKAALLEMNSKGGSMEVYVSDNKTDENARTYYLLKSNVTQLVVDKGPFKTKVNYNYENTTFTNGYVFVNLTATIAEANAIESITLTGKFVITLP